MTERSIAVGAEHTSTATVTRLVFSATRMVVVYVLGPTIREAVPASITGVILIEPRTQRFWGEPYVIAAANLQLYALSVGLIGLVSHALQVCHTNSLPILSCSLLVIFNSLGATSIIPVLISLAHLIGIFFSVTPRLRIVTLPA